MGPIGLILLRKSCLSKDLEEIRRRLYGYLTRRNNSAKVLSQKSGCIVGGRTKRPVWLKLSNRERELLETK